MTARRKKNQNGPLVGNISFHWRNLRNKITLRLSIVFGGFNVTLKNLALSATCAAALVTPAMAGELVYTPINPSFGGAALNSSHLLSLATAQRTATIRSSGSSQSEDADETFSNAELFVRQLENRLLSRLSQEVGDAIFGTSTTDPADQGAVTFGTTTVSFRRTDNTDPDYPDSVVLTILDTLTNEQTVIAVPQLVIPDDGNT